METGRSESNSDRDLGPQLLAEGVQSSGRGDAPGSGDDLQVDLTEWLNQLGQSLHACLGYKGDGQAHRTRALDRRLEGGEPIRPALGGDEVIHTNDLRSKRPQLSSLTKVTNRRNAAPMRRCSAFQVTAVLISTRGSAPVLDDVARGALTGAEELYWRRKVPRSFARSHGAIGNK